MLIYLTRSDLPVVGAGERPADDRDSVKKLKKGVWTAKGSEWSHPVQTNASNTLDNPVSKCYVMPCSNSAKEGKMFVVKMNSDNRKGPQASLALSSVSCDLHHCSDLRHCSGVTSADEGVEFGGSSTSGSSGSTDGTSPNGSSDYSGSCGTGTEVGSDTSSARYHQSLEELDNVLASLDSLCFELGNGSGSNPLHPRAITRPIASTSVPNFKSLPTTCFPPTVTSRLRKPCMDLPSVPERFREPLHVKCSSSWNSSQSQVATATHPNLGLLMVVPSTEIPEQPLQSLCSVKIGTSLKAEPLKAEPLKAAPLKAPRLQRAPPVSKTMVKRTYRREAGIWATPQDGGAFVKGTGNSTSSELSTSVLIGRSGTDLPNLDLAEFAIPCTAEGTVGQEQCQKNEQSRCKQASISSEREYSRIKYGRESHRVPAGRLSGESLSVPTVNCSGESPRIPVGKFSGESQIVPSGKLIGEFQSHLDKVNQENYYQEVGSDKNCGNIRSPPLPKFPINLNHLLTPNCELDFASTHRSTHHSPTPPFPTLSSNYDNISVMSNGINSRGDVQRNGVNPLENNPIPEIDGGNREDFSSASVLPESSRTTATIRPVALNPGNTSVALAKHADAKSTEPTYDDVPEDDDYDIPWDWNKTAAIVGDRIQMYAAERSAQNRNNARLPKSSTPSIHLASAFKSQHYSAMQSKSLSNLAYGAVSNGKVAGSTTHTSAVGGSVCSNVATSSSKEKHVKDATIGTSMSCSQTSTNAYSLPALTTTLKDSTPGNSNAKQPSKRNKTMSKLSRFLCGVGRKGPYKDTASPDDEDRSEYQYSIPKGKLEESIPLPTRSVSVQPLRPSSAGLEDRAQLVTRSASSQPLRLASLNLLAPDGSLSDAEKMNGEPTKGCSALGKVATTARVTSEETTVAGEFPSLREHAVALSMSQSQPLTRKSLKRLQKGICLMGIADLQQRKLAERRRPSVGDESTGGLLQHTFDPGETFEKSKDAASDLGSCSGVPCQFGHLLLRLQLTGRQIAKERTKPSEERIYRHIVRAGSLSSSQFGEKITNFIKCTKGTRDKSSQVITQNIRQFMNGIKNHLMTEDDTGLLTIVQEEQLRLRADEVLCIDDVMESALYYLLLRPLHDFVITAMERDEGRRDHLLVCIRGMSKMQDQNMDQLGILPSTFAPPTADVVEAVGKKIRLMYTAYSPKRKLELWLEAVYCVLSACHPPLKPEETMPSDALQRTMAYCMVLNYSTGVELMSDYVVGLIHPAVLGGKDGWFVTMLKGTVTVCKELCFLYEDNPPNQPLCSAQMHEVSARGSMTVYVPNEDYRSLECIKVPVKTGDTACQLCEHICSKRDIPNPSDYRIYRMDRGKERELDPSDSMDSYIGLTLERLVFKNRRLVFIWPRSFMQ